MFSHPPAAQGRLPDRSEGDLWRLLAEREPEVAAEVLAWEPEDTADDVAQRQFLVLLCHVVLLMRMSPPSVLVARLRVCLDVPDALNQRLCSSTLAVIDAPNDTRAQALEAAAFALLNLERQHPSPAAQLLLADATLELDGPLVARRFLERPEAQAQQSPLFDLLCARVLLAEGEAHSARAHARACVDSGGWLAREALPTWLDALRKDTKTPADESIRELSGLRDDLRTPDVWAALARLLNRRDGAASAHAAWTTAVMAGWTDFDDAFIDALGTLELDDEALRRVAKAGELRRSRVLVKLAGLSAVPTDVLEILCNTDVRGVTVALAENPATPVGILESLSSTGVYEALAVASNPSTPASLLQALSTRPEMSVRRAVAGSPSCPLAILEILARDDEEPVLVAVRDNPVTPDSLRVQIALVL